MLIELMIYLIFFMSFTSPTAHSTSPGWKTMSGVGVRKLS